MNWSATLAFHQTTEVLSHCLPVIHEETLYNVTSYVEIYVAVRDEYNLIQTKLEIKSKR
jgi:hypothetical protein